MEAERLDPFYGGVKSISFQQKYEVVFARYDHRRDAEHRAAVKGSPEPLDREMVYARQRCLWWSRNPPASEANRHDHIVIGTSDLSTWTRISRASAMLCDV
jgi:hypothetical protein